MTDQPTSDPSSDQDSADFYWRQSRENLFTDAGVRMFQLAYAHRGEPFEQARTAIDLEYARLTGEAKRHGGLFATYIGLLEELGLMFREDREGTVYLQTTPAGDQAGILLSKLPDALRVIPYFVVELLSRYRLNNPLTKTPNNAALGAMIAESDVFPYWSLYKIIRSLGNRITKDELARFVFKLKRMADIPKTIDAIKAFRADRAAGVPDSHLDTKYGAPLAGAIGQPKYIMGRAGFQVGVIEQDGDEYKLAEAYLPFVDAVLAVEPKFEELDEKAWLQRYGSPVKAARPQLIPFQPEPVDDDVESQIPDTDEIYVTAVALLEKDEYAGVLLIGPPGTGKTWYARQIAIKLAAYKQSRIREVQFHPSYQYEDFVEGYVPDGKGSFALADRHLLEVCREAYGSTAKHVLIIDELSRVDPARVMGEAMTYMESTLRDVPFFLPSGRQMVIPANLIFLATMNPEDRSVDEIDTAMDRRWGKIFLRPDPVVLSSFGSAKGVKPEVTGEILKFFNWVQEHYALGHAYFRTVNDLSSLQRLWNSQLRFVFQKAFRHDTDTFEEIEANWAKMVEEVRKILAT